MVGWYQGPGKFTPIQRGCTEINKWRMKHGGRGEPANPHSPGKWPCVI